MKWAPKTFWHCIFFPRRTLALIKELQANQRKKFTGSYSPGSLPLSEIEWWCPEPLFSVKHPSEE